MLSQTATERQQTTVWLSGVRQSGWAAKLGTLTSHLFSSRLLTSHFYQPDNLSSVQYFHHQFGHLQTSGLPALITGTPGA